MKKQNLLYLLLLMMVSCKKDPALTPELESNQIQVAFSAQTIGFATVDSAIIFLDRANTPTVKQKMQGFNGNKFILETESLVTGEYDVTIRLYTKKDADNHSRVHIYKKKITLPAGKQIINAPSGKLMDATWRPNIILKDDAKGIIVIMAERQDDPFIEMKVPSDFNYMYVYRDAHDSGNNLVGSTYSNLEIEDFINDIYSSPNLLSEYATQMQNQAWATATFQMYVQFGNDSNGNLIEVELEGEIQNRP